MNELLNHDDLPESLGIFEKPSDEQIDNFDAFFDNIVLDHKN